MRAVGNGSAQVTAAFGRVAGHPTVVVTQRAGPFDFPPPPDSLRLHGDTVRLKRSRYDGVLRSKTLPKLSPLAAVVLFALVTSCEEDTVSIHVPPLPCSNLFAVEPTKRPIVVSVGSSRRLSVRLLQEFFGRDRYRHCPVMSLHEFVWTVDDASVARLEGHGKEVTVTGVAVGATSISVRYGDYLDPTVRVGDGRIRRRVSIEVVGP